MDRSNWLQKVALLGIILMLLLSTSCAQPIEEPEPEVVETIIVETEVTEPESTPTSSLGRSVKNQPPILDAHLNYDVECREYQSTVSGAGDAGNGYITDQVLITGDPEKITDVVSRNSGLFVSPGDPIIKVELPDVFSPYGLFEIHLYKLAITETVGSVVAQISRFVQSNGIDYVFAEPNYVTAFPNNPETGDLPGTSADPCRGCSGGISGNLGATGSASIAVPYGQQEFLNQWAFSSPGTNNGSIGLYDQNEWVGYSAGQVLTGDNVEIAVFDTIPTGLSNDMNHISWASIPFDLCVMRTGVILRPGEDTRGITNIDQIALQEHGLFVTGLAQGVAPAARYFLVEALNEQGKGDVASLIFGMNEYAKARRAINSDSLINTVINLSLGLELEKFPQMIDDEVTISIDQLRVLLTTLEWDYLDSLDAKIIPSVALQLAMTAYEQNGATIVAAAGNDMLSTPQSPAGFTDVLGVKSININGVESCFSNAGDVGAPGGDGEGSSCNRDMENLCKGYPFIGDCPHVVISIVSNNPALGSNQPNREGFGYWAGTSMSTPMVSGLAALLLEQCPNTDPITIRELIKDAHDIFGVIRVLEAIELRCTPLP